MPQTIASNPSKVHLKAIRGLEYFTGNHPEVRAQFRSGLRPTEFGNKVWATSLRLIEDFYENSGDLGGQRVLEIGCGWGLVGLYLAKALNCKVTCSDLDPHVLPIVGLLAKHNNVSVVTAQAGFADLSSEFLKNFDVIVGAEVCYSQAVAEDLLAMMERAFASGVQKVIIADPGRPDFEEGLFRCQEFSKVVLKKLPGSPNGKTTTLLTCHKKSRSGSL